MHRAVREAQAAVLLLLLQAGLLLGAFRVQHTVRDCREEVLDEHLCAGLQRALLQNGPQTTLNPESRLNR